MLFFTKYESNLIVYIVSAPPPFTMGDGGGGEGVT